MRSFLFLLLFNDCSSITIWIYQTCSSSFCSFSCTLSVGVSLFVFKIIKFVDFPYKKNICRSMEKKHKNPLGTLCSRVPIMHAIDYYSARSKYHLTIGNLVCTYLRSPRLWRFGCPTKTTFCFKNRKYGKIGISIIFNQASTVEIS